MCAAYCAWFLFSHLLFKSASGGAVISVSMCWWLVMWKCFMYFKIRKPDFRKTSKQALNYFVSNSFTTLPKIILKPFTVKKVVVMATGIEWHQITKIEAEDNKGLGNSISLVPLIWICSFPLSFFLHPFLAFQSGFRSEQTHAVSAQTFIKCDCLLGILWQTDKKQQKKPREALCCRWLSAPEIESKFISVLCEQPPSSGLPPTNMCEFNISSCNLGCISLRTVTLLVQQLLEWWAFT